MPLCTDRIGINSPGYSQGMGIPARYTRVPTCYVFFLAEGETNFLFNPCSSVFICVLIVLSLKT